MQHTVLFVDDNPVTLKVIENTFAGESYDVMLAASGEEALLLVNEKIPHVIVSDLRMPGIDGLDFLSRARQHNDHFIGIICTGYVDIDSIMQAVGSEAVWRYITKPWNDNRELILAVRNALQYHDAMLARRQAEEHLNRAERLSALGHLVAGISHQFNNINVGIMGYAQMALVQQDLSTEVRDDLDHILKFTKRATEIVKELAAFSDQSAQWGFGVGDLNAAVREGVAFRQKELDDEGIELELRLTDIPEAVINYGLVQQIFINLLNNACHATLGQEERKVIVETGQIADRVFLRVIDNGCGIAPAYLKKVFDPFFTTKGAQAVAGSSQASVSGVGLGLSLSQTVAQSHNGEIAVQSTEGEGSEFTFLLPIA